MVRRFFKNLILRITSCVMVLVTLFSAGGCSLADVFAWMSDNGLSSPIDITSNVHKTYFNGGDGSEKNPYQIDNALQLYYFAWLQDLGLFNVDSDDEGTQIDTVYFVLTNNIDMSGYQLPPIGTTEHPFLGNFDGQGYTVSNLTVENEREHLFEPPEGSSEISKYTEIIGFFGVVGSINDKYKNEDGTYNYATQANKATNLVIEDITIITHTKHALVGFVAGYVNGTVDLVGVADGTVKVSTGTQALSCTTNISDYSIIGYCAPEYKKELYVFGASLNKPGVTKTYTIVLQNSNDGEGQGWGGSVKMQDIFSWLDDSMGTTSRSYTYVYERIDVVGLNGTRTTTKRSSESRDSYSVDGFGAYVGSTMNWEGGINFVGGGQKVTEYAYEYSDEDVNVYYITDGTNYLNFYGDEITSDIEGSNTKWYASEGTNGGVLYTVVDNTVYYLTITNDNLSVLQDVNADPGNLPTWKNVGNGYTLNNQRLIFNNGNWTLDSSFKIYYRNNNTNYYLTNNGTNDVQAVQNDNQAVTWTMTAVNGGYQISTVISNTTYYLAYTQSGNWFNQNVTGPTLSRNASTWQYENGQFYVSVTSGFGGGTTNYYLRYNNNNDWTIANNTSNSLLSFAYSTDSNVEIISSSTTQKAISFTQREYIDTSLENGEYDNGEKQPTGAAGISYLPLSKDENSWSVASTNTGYIVGAEWGALEKGEGHDADGANIRISAYNTSNITNPDEPYTMTYKTGGKFKTISDTSAETANLLGLQKYTEALRKDYTSSMEQYCYGLHFMEASVSESNKATITAKLKGETIEGYEVPTNCIDFHLYDGGFINFVAGSYYTQGDGNDSFFSIYKVERNSDGKTIKSIKEIYKIYGLLDTTNNIVTSEEYYYTYVKTTGYDSSGNPIRIEVDENGNTVTLNDKGVPTSAPTGYDMIFDCRWITHPDNSAYYQGNTAPNPTAWTDNRAYYFEVPVNKGEYAIGSTKDRTGAYLVYLDLAANAQLLDRVKEYEEIVENKAQASIPTGRVDMLALEEGKEYTLDELKTILGNVDPFTSAFASITTDAGGGTPENPSSITVTRTGNTIKFVTQNGGVRTEYIYVESALSVDGKLENVPITETTTIKRVTYRDKNKTTGDLTVTVLSEITVTKLENGQTTKTTTYLKEITVTDKNGNPVGNPTRKEITNLKEFVPDTEDPATGIESSAVGGKLIDIAFAYETEVELKISYSYLHEGLDEQNRPVGTYVILIENPGENLVTLKAILTDEGLAAIKSGIKIVITDGTKETMLNATTDAQMVEIAGTGSTEDPPAQPEEQPTE